MTHHKHLTGSLLALGICIALPPVTAADTSPGFRIMTPEEVATHSAAMSALQGEAREAYRNAHYEQLKARAVENGFSMPPAPPWATPALPDQAAAVMAPAAPGTDQDATGAAARHAAMREKMQAHREAIQPVSEGKLDSPRQAASAEPPPQDQQPVTATMPASEPTQPSPTFAPVEAAATAAAAVAEVPPPSSPAPLEAPANAAAASMEPRFAPVEEAAVTTTPAPPTTDASVAAGSTAVQAAPEGPAAAGGTDRPYAGSDAMTAYREAMRSRFDQYMNERQAQLQDAARRQREQHEAEMERQRAMQAERSRIQPPPYPAMPAYGPRYPEAFPGYRTPYWQQR